MNAEHKDYPTVNYDAYARTVPIDDYWGQVKRTINGKQIEEAQINLIVETLVDLLGLDRGDAVLDLACGNGALSSRIAPYSRQLHGVDISPYLIQVAKRAFMIADRITFELSDVMDYVMNVRNPRRYTKVVIYGSFQYFRKNDALKLLEILYNRFVNVKIVVIGNIPDRDKYHAFYANRNPGRGELDDPEASIGVWYNSKQLQEQAKDYGWNSSVHFMPRDFYATSYRFNLILER